MSFISFARLTNGTPGVNRKRFLLGLGASTLIVAFTASHAFAWTAPTGLGFEGSSAPIRFSADCGVSTSGNIWAENGDVVTTTKWNQLICRVYQTLSILYDWGRNSTPFLTYTTAQINGAGAVGTHVSAVQLAGPGGGGAVNFYSSTGAFTSQNALGSIRYVSATPGEGIHLTSNNGPVYIDTVNNTATNMYANDETNGNKQFALGWVGLTNLFDQGEFDPLCMYRVTTDHLHVIYMTVVNGGYIRAYLDANHDAKLGQPGRVGVPKENKTELQNSIEVGSATPTANYGTKVSMIEKLCLPRYYEADTPVSVYKWNGAGLPENFTVKKNAN